jgi:hypothetical protein
VPACGAVPVNTSLRRLASLAATAFVAVALAACGSSGTPSAHQSGAGVTHRTSTSTTAGGSTTQSSLSSTTSSTSTTTAPASPDDVTFSPFTALGGVAPGLQVTQEVSGHCTGPGVAGSASYRCIAEPGAVPYDPCFAPPVASGGSLLCVPDPAVIDVIGFTAGALPKASTSVPPTRVWAMRLNNGEVCVLVNAPWDGRGPFACPTPSAAASVADCRAPTQTAQGWSTECQAKENAASPFTVTPVVNVWT